MKKRRPKPRLYKPRRNVEILRKGGPHKVQKDYERKPEEIDYDECDLEDDELERWARDIANE